MLRIAEESIGEAVNNSKPNSNPIYALGGCEKACTLMAIAMLDTDGDGRLTPDDGMEVIEVGQRLVSSNKDFQAPAPHRLRRLQRCVCACGCALL